MLLYLGVSKNHKFRCRDEFFVGIFIALTKFTFVFYQNNWKHTSDQGNKAHPYMDDLLAYFGHR